MNDFNNCIRVIKDGTTEILKIYKGTSLIWQKPNYSWFNQNGSTLTISGAVTKVQSGSTLTLS